MTNKKKTVYQEFFSQVICVHFCVVYNLKVDAYSFWSHTFMEIWSENLKPTRSSSQGKLIKIKFKRNLITTTC